MQLSKLMKPPLYIVSLHILRTSKHKLLSVKSITES